MCNLCKTEDRDGYTMIKEHNLVLNGVEMGFISAGVFFDGDDIDYIEAAIETADHNTIENLIFIPKYCPLCGRKLKEE